MSFPGSANIEADMAMPMKRTKETYRYSRLGDVPMGSLQNITSMHVVVVRVVVPIKNWKTIIMVVMRKHGP